MSILTMRGPVALGVFVTATLGAGFTSAASTYIGAELWPSSTRRVRAWVLAPHEVDRLVPARPSDTPEKLDYDRLARAVIGMNAVVVDLSGG